VKLSVIIPTYNRSIILEKNLLWDFATKPHNGHSISTTTTRGTTKKKSSGAISRFMSLMLLPSYLIAA
jgi:hypothetical protein